MDETNAAKPATTQALSPDQVAAVSGGDGCTTTVTIAAGDTSVVSTYDSFGAALIGTYDGLVDATSYVIERLASTTK